MTLNKKEAQQYMFFVDMSGQPYVDDIFIGGIFMNKKYVTQFIKEFYMKFPHLRSFKKKSHNLNKDQLKEIINFMSQKKIKMVCIKFHKHKMNKYEKEILERKNKYKVKSPVKLMNFKEKILGALYYQLIQPYARKGWHYEMEVCVESHLDILQVMRSLQKLSYRDGFKIHPRTNYRRIQHMLKFADFVAGAGRKVEDFVLRTFPGFVYSAPEVTEYDSNNLFGIGSPTETELQTRLKIASVIKVPTKTVLSEANELEKEKLINTDVLSLISDETVGNDSQESFEKTDN